MWGELNATQVASTEVSYVFQKVTSLKQISDLEDMMNEYYSAIQVTPIINGSRLTSKKGASKVQRANLLTRKQLLEHLFSLN